MVELPNFSQFRSSLHGFLVWCKKKRTRGNGGGVEGETNWEIRIDIYTLPLCKIASQWEPAVQHRELSSVLCDDLDGQDGGDWGEVQEGGDICIHIADSLHCTAETNTTLQSNCTPIKEINKYITKTAGIQLKCKHTDT